MDTPVGQFQYSTDMQPISINGISIDISEQKYKDDQLVEIKGQLDLVLKNLPAGLLLINKKREIVFANERATMFTKRWSNIDVVGGVTKDLHQSVGEYFSFYTVNGERINLENSRIEKTFITNQSIEEIFRIEYKSGISDKWVVFSCSPLLNTEGQTIMVLVTFTDITTQMIAEQRLRQSEEQLRFLAESIPQLVWLMNDKGECMFRNSKWEEYTGVDVPNFDLWKEIVHPDDLNRVSNIWREGISTGTKIRDELRLRNKFGDYRWHSLSGEPIKNDEGVIIRWLGIYSDIHDQKTATERLENLVAIRTKELQRSNEDLQQFAHVASHDMKEPLRKIKIFGSRLQDEFRSELPEKAHLYLEKIESASNRLFSMVDGVLQYSLLNASLQRTEEIDLNDLFVHIISDLELRILHSNARILYANLPVVQGAPILIYQLFFNLVSNSLKFQSGHDAPLIEVDFETISINHIPYFSIRIRDNGIGFEQEYAEKIFNSFSRLNSKDRFEGTGLGLALCKKITERHNGSIEASASVGKGAIFTVTLPVYQKGGMV